MDNNNQQSAPSNPMINNPSSTSASMPKKTGPMIGILVVVLILIIGALYLFASKLSTPATPSDETSMMDSSDNSAAVQNVQPVTNTSDDVQSLQNDLNSANVGEGQSF